MNINGLLLNTIIHFIEYVKYVKKKQKFDYFIAWKHKEWELAVNAAYEIYYSKTGNAMFDNYYDIAMSKLKEDKKHFLEFQENEKNAKKLAEQQAEYQAWRNKRFNS
jgi:hypothetical protein